MNPVLFAFRFVSLIMRGLLCVITRNKKGYRKFRQDFGRMFPERTPEEEEELLRDTPPNMQWWAAEERRPTPTEATLSCKTCDQPIGSGTVKECPNCHVTMHSKCYDKPYGQSYQTPDCRACYLRCYSR